MTVLAHKKVLVGEFPKELFLDHYLNNLLTMKDAGDITSFADDTVVFYKESCWQTLKIKIEEDFGNILNWFNYTQ